MTTLPELDADRLHQRLDFLETRARAHLEAGGETAQRHAATLLRDAGCITLLLDDREWSKRLLVEAGLLLLDLGVLEGGTLLALAGEFSPLTGYRGLSLIRNILRGVTEERGREDARPDEHDDERPPIPDEARPTPRRLLALMQMTWLAPDREDGPLIENEARVRRALARHGGTPVGLTGLTLDTYVGIADELALPARAPQARDDGPPAVWDAFSALAFTRREYIRAAMKDVYHWRFMPKPAELMDLDTVILAVLALRRNIAQDALLKLFGQDLPLADAPVRAAMTLRG